MLRSCQQRNFFCAQAKILSIVLICGSSLAKQEHEESLNSTSDEGFHIFYDRVTDICIRSQFVGYVYITQLLGGKFHHGKTVNYYASEIVDKDSSNVIKMTKEMPEVLYFEMEELRGKHTKLLIGGVFKKLPVKDGVEKEGVAVDSGIWKDINHYAPIYVSQYGITYTGFLHHLCSLYNNFITESLDKR